jgi:cytochrome P450
VCLRECHRRADLFPDPEAFDPDRFLERPPQKDSYAPFGEGSHSCPAANLVRMIARAFLVELAAGFETQVLADGRPERGNRHWNHWHPSSAFRLSLVARSAGPQPPSTRSVTPVAAV